MQWWSDSSEDKESASVSSLLADGQGIRYAKADGKCQSGRKGINGEGDEVGDNG
jgi:hypothetical protein